MRYIFSVQCESKSGVLITHNSAGLKLFSKFGQQDCEEFWARWPGELQGIPKH